MEYQEYIKQKSKLYEHFLCFIDGEEQDNKLFEEVICDIEKNEYHKNVEEFKSILYLISEVSQNHHRGPGFFTKIERILSHYSEYIKQSFTKHELFRVFKKSPRILRFFFEENIITIDDSIAKLLLDESRTKCVIRLYGSEVDAALTPAKFESVFKGKITRNYRYYFFKDIKSYLDEETRQEIERLFASIELNIFDNFEEKCLSGENDSYICKLIRNDSVEEFISYVSKVNLPLNSLIPFSIFDTNPFMSKRGVELIEYAAFFGSIRIFNYLRMNEVALTPSLWLYSIHGNNPRIIHILNENNVNPPKGSHIYCLKESIKCHHNNIARYIESNLLKEPIDINENNFSNNPVSFGFHHRNYEFIHEQEEPANLQLPLFLACKYDYFPIVELLIKKKKVDINKTII